GDDLRRGVHHRLRDVRRVDVDDLARLHRLAGAGEVEPRWAIAGRAVDGVTLEAAVSGRCRASQLREAAHRLACRTTIHVRRAGGGGGGEQGGTGVEPRV